MKKVKIIVDILMTILFILLMCNQLTGIFAHEVLGVSVIKYNDVDFILAVGGGSVVD